MDGQSLAQAVERWNLLEHPFYVSWSEGRLPLATLSLYAAEYGNFIRAIPTAWQAIGEAGIAAVEEDHADLWDLFADSLGASVGAPAVPAVAALCDEFRAMAGSADTAVGALYAFEGQQPGVARSKLEGLEQHYRAVCPDVAVGYFQAHIDDYAEPALLEARFASFAPPGRQRASAAATAIGRALWTALDGILIHEASLPSPTPSW